MTTFRLFFITTLAIFLSACSSLFFYPSATLIRNPADVKLSYQDVFIEVSTDVQLHGWWLPAKGEVKGTIYFLHGNAQNISTHLASVYWLPEQGYQVLLLDYRGYGLSTGTPDIPEVFDDVYAGYQWLKDYPSTKNKPLFLLGQSLGAVIGAYTTTQHQDMLASFDAIILDSPFSSFPLISKDVASRSWITWPLQYPLFWSMTGKYNLIDVIDKISPNNLLLMHSRQDQVIPYYHAEHLFNAAKEPKIFYSYQGKHISIFEDNKNRQYLLDYLETHSPP